MYPKKARPKSRGNFVKLFDKIDAKTGVKIEASIKLNKYPK